MPYRENFCKYNFRFINSIFWILLKHFTFRISIMQSQEVGLVNFATVWQTPYFNSRVLQHRLVFYFAADKGIPIPRVFLIIVVALVD